MMNVLAVVQKLKKCSFKKVNLFKIQPFRFDCAEK